MMFRTVVVSLGSCGLLLSLAGVGWSQEWPHYTQNPLERGPGDYLAWYKILLTFLVVLPWVRTTDWINRDTIELGDRIELPSEVWNPIVVFTFLAAFLLLLMIPIFPVGFSILIVAYVIPLITYILLRNGRVNDDEKVLTPSHLKQWFASIATGKRKKKKDTAHIAEAGPSMQIAAEGGTDTENQSHLVMARQSPGFVLTKELIADAVHRRATRVMLDYTKESVGTRYDIDGIWHVVEPRDRESGDVLLAVMKKLSCLNMDERRAKQVGHFQAKFEGNKFTVHLASQGTKTGERAVVELEPNKLPFSSLDDLGMRDNMRDELKEFLGSTQGFVLFSAMPGGGLQTTWNVGLSATDRYLRDFAALEHHAKNWTHVENVELFTYGSNDEETAEKVLRTVLLREPDALVLPDLIDATIVDRVIEAVNQDGRFLAGAIRSKDAAEALLRVVAMQPDVEKFAQATTAVLGQRLVRKLCETCRQAYEPPPQLLQKLGIPAGRVEVLFREYQPPPPGSKKRKGEPEVCPDCSGIGYRGQTGIFELIKMDEPIRQALVGQPQLEVIRKLARQAHNPTLQEEGVLLVARGITSLNELQRVLKQ